MAFQLDGGVQTDEIPVSLDSGRCEVLSDADLQPAGTNVRSIVLIDRPSSESKSVTRQLGVRWFYVSIRCPDRSHLSQR